ncbi:MFS transporter [Brackiella oedipodis]|uniref:MFS transporter n=1 Tax=Brackiella oedipodis TaxID=124225 RepID=UPI00048F7447|nr:MFS transporter [Brackiella oedipodis]
MMTQTTAHRWQGFFILLAILLVSANLRAPVTILGPLINPLSTQFHLSNSTLGMLTTLPLLAFGFFSPVANWFSHKIGLLKSLSFGMLLIIIGHAIRLMASVPTLYAGTLLISCGIAVGNVLLPVVVKSFFPKHVALVTSSYVLFMGIIAGAGSSLMIPLTEHYGFSNQAALTSVVIFAILALCACLPWGNLTSPSHQSSHTDQPKNRLWRYPLAWYVTLYGGINSTIYYAMITWLPNILIELGQSPEQAGATHGLLQLASALPGFVIVPLMKKFDDQRHITLLMSLSLLVSFLGLILLPSMAVVWSFLFGFSSGGVFLLALIFMVIRTSTTSKATALSAMAQLVGYILAAIAPPIFGALHDASSSWMSTLWVFVVLALAITLMGALSSRNRTI